MAGDPLAGSSCLAVSLIPVILTSRVTHSQLIHSLLVQGETNLKKFVLGLIVGLLIPAIGGVNLYIKMGHDAVATASAPLPMEEKIAKMALRARMAKDRYSNARPRRRSQLDPGCAIFTLRIALSAMALPAKKPALPPRACSPYRHSCYPATTWSDDPPGQDLLESGERNPSDGMPGSKRHAHATQTWQVSLMLQHADKLPDQTESGRWQAGSASRCATQPDACGNAGQKANKNRCQK